MARGGVSRPRGARRYEELHPGRRVRPPRRVVRSSSSCSSLLAAGLCLAGPAAAKSFFIDDVRIDAAVRANGDLLVTERRAFAFDGAFHYVYWDLGAKGSRRHRGPRRRGPGRARWNASIARSGPGTVSSRPAESITRDWPSVPMGSSADVHPAVPRARRGQAVPDTAELYWQFVGDGWGVETRQGRRRRHAPQRREAAPGARLGTRPAERLGEHRAGRPGASTWSGTCRRRRSSRAASCSPAGRSLQGSGRSTCEELPIALREEKQWADEAQRAAPPASSRSARPRRGARPPGA